MKTAYLVLSLLLLSACASTGQEEATSSSAPPAAQPSPAAAPAATAKQAEPQKKATLPTLSAAQSAQLDRTLNFKVSNPLLGKMIEEARPVIRDFVATNACINNDDGTALKAYVASDKQAPAHGYSAPMAGVAKHNPAACLTPASSQNWVAITKDHLRFVLNYQADSGEIEKVRHELKRQSGGKWLFVR